MAPWASETLPRFLRPATAAARRAWQPANFLPDPSRPAATFSAAVASLRAAAAQLPDELVVCLALAAVSDAALPLQLPALLNASAAAAAAAATATTEAPPHHLPPRDHSGSDAHAWASLARAWSAEAKRHGDALRGWLYLSGRADVGELDRSTQRLLGGGAALVPAVPAEGDGGAEQQQRRPATRATDYYAALMYAAYHLRCDGVAAANAARLAAYHMGEEEADAEGEEEERHGVGGGRGSSGGGSAAASTNENDSASAAAAAAAASLPRLLSAIAADKARHEAAFSAAVGEAARRDPLGTLAALSSALASGALLRSPAAALGCEDSAAADGESGGAAATPSSSPSSSLFLDASAAADALGVLTLRDRASALDALCAQWGVAAAGEAAASDALERGDDEAAREARARAAFALGHGARLRALADLQTERRLRDRRKGRARAAPFAWVFGRECGLS